MAQEIDYFEFELEQKLECPACGLVSTALALLEVADESADLVCPCGEVIATVSFPSVVNDKRSR